MQTTYAPITEIELLNFMSIAHANIPVKQIVSLCGYNDQGKSAVRTALEVLLYDAYATEQVRLIKDGTDAFKVILRFADGVEVSKEKRIDGVSVWNMFKTGTTLYTNVRSDGTVVAVEDVPECIAMYFGVYFDESTRQELNIRKDRDPYFLVDSSGGDNYKLLNPLLYSETLSKASDLLLKDSNACKSEYDTASIRLSVVQEQLDSKVLVPEDVLDVLDNSIANVQKASERQEQVEAVDSAYIHSQSYVIPPQVKSVDSTRLELLDRVIVAHNAANVPTPPAMSLVDTTKLELLQRIIETQQSITPIYDAVPQVDCVRIELLEKLYAATVQVEQSKQKLAQLETANTTVCSELQGVTSKLDGMGYKVCKHCGNLVE